MAKIELNPLSMLSEIGKDFDIYMQNLKDTSKTELRNNFEKVFDIVYNDEISLLSQNNKSY